MKDVSILKENGVDLDKSLELFGDMETYDQMLEDFLKEVDGKLSDAKKYKDEGDMANYAIMVHSLKSDSRYFGMMALGDMFYEHELAGKANDYTFVTNNFDKLMQEARRMIDILKKYMGVEVSSPVVESNPGSSVETILVVDDSNIIRNFIQKIFEGKYNVKIAGDGEEAISIIGNTPSSSIACMFLDLNMPGVDGFQVLEYLKSRNLFGQIPTSVITGAEDLGTIQRAFSYPIVDILKKPFNEESVRNFAMKTIAQKK